MKNPPFPEIPESEYRLRIERAADLMRQNGVSAYLLFCEENIGYFTGFRRTFESPTVVWIALAINDRGEASLVTDNGIYNIINKSTHLEDIRSFGGSDYWDLPSDPIKLVTDMVRERMGKGTVLGLELGYGMHPRITPNELETIRNEFTEYEVRDVAGELWTQKAVKSPYEQLIYRELGEATGKGFLAGMQFACAGVTERDILKVMLKTFIEEGAFDTPMRGQLMIRSGVDRHDMYCARPSDRVLETGDQIMLDSGPCYQGYVADIQRHVFIGEPPQLERELYHQSAEGLQAALDAIRPGARASDVWKAAQERMVAVGVNNNVHWSFFGHSIGMTNHEPPFITPYDHTPIEEGMVLSVEVPAYDVPQFRVLGAFLEEVVLVTANGCELLTGAAPRDLWVV